MRTHDRHDLARRNARQQVDLVMALRDLRVERDLSVADVARDMGVDAAMVYRFEKGGTNFTMTTLRKYAQAVGARLRLEAAPEEPAAQSSATATRAASPS